MYKRHFHCLPFSGFPHFAVVSAFAYSSGRLAAVWVYAGAALLLWLLWATYRWVACSLPPLLLYNDRLPANRRLVAACPLLKLPYVPSFLSLNPHVMLVVGAIARGISWNLLSFRHEILRTADGGDIGIDHPRLLHGQADLPASAPLVIALHGVTGHSKVNYMRHFAWSALRAGWRVVCITNRGLGTVPLATARSYNAGCCEDLRTVVAVMRERYPHAPLAAVGFSMGANILCKYLGEEGNDTPLVAACSVCNPFDLNLANEKLSSTGLHRALYNRKLANNLKQIYFKNQKVFEEAGSKVEASVLRQAGSVEEFDKAYILPQLPFRSVAHYYEESSSKNYLDGIQVPLLCLNALDDPFCDQRSLPSEEYVRSHSNIFLCVTHSGSHVSFLEGLNPFHRRSWGDRVALQFLGQALRQMEAK